MLFIFAHFFQFWSQNILFLASSYSYDYEYLLVIHTTFHTFFSTFQATSCVTVISFLCISQLSFAT